MKQETLEFSLQASGDRYLELVEIR